MLLRPYFIVLLFLVPMIGKGNNDPIIIRSYFGVHLGGTYNMGLNEFNADLSKNTISELPDIAFGGGFDYAISFNRSKLTANFDFETLQNGSKLPEARVLINCLGLTMNYGFDVFGRSENIRFEPFIGAGISDAQLFITTHDTTGTLTQISNGAQNLYYERPSIGIILDAGLRYEYYPQKKVNRIAFFGQANYQLQLNEYKWTIEDMSLTQLSKFNLSLGIRFRINCVDNQKVTK